MVMTNEERLLELVAETRERWLTRQRRHVPSFGGKPLYIWSAQRIPRWETLDRFNGVLGYDLSLVIDNGQQKTVVMPVSQHITREIFCQLEWRGLTRKELCSAAKLSKSSLTGYATGTEHPLPLTTVRIFDALGCHLSYQFD